MKLKIVNNGKLVFIEFSAKRFETFPTHLFCNDSIDMDLPDDIELTITLNDQLCKNQ